MTNRNIIITEALSWVGTPYHLRGMIKGVGCDCATFILCVMINCGIFSEDTSQQINQLSNDWWKNTTEERYLAQVLRYAGKVAQSICYQSTVTQPGNIVLGKVAGSRVYNHGAIIVKWPMAVHAAYPKVVLADLSRDPLWAYRDITIFDPFIPGG